MPDTPNQKSSFLLQQYEAVAFLQKHGVARMYELRREGIPVRAVQRACDRGYIVQLERGLYCLPDVPVASRDEMIAQAARNVPNGVICLESALAFHGLTDDAPGRIWMAVGRENWATRGKEPLIVFVLFGPKTFGTGIKTHIVHGAPVRVYTPAKTVTDLFRYRHRVGFGVALDAMRAALRQRKASPASILRYANETGIGKIIAPFLAGMTDQA